MERGPPGSIITEVEDVAVAITAAGAFVVLTFPTGEVGAVAFGADGGWRSECRSGNLKAATRD